MGRIQPSIGLITGMPIQEIVDQLMGISSKPRDLLVERTQSLQNEQTALNELLALLLKVQYVAKNLGKAGLYDQRQAVSDDPSALGVTVTGQPPVGVYRFSPLRMVQSQQLLSSRFRSETDPIGSGKLTFRFGPHVQRAASLDLLGGGQGVARGKIRITDRSGASAEIDLSTVQTVEDVLRAVNNDPTVRVAAVAQGDGIRLIDRTGQTVSNLRVQEVGGGSTAASLGLDGIDVGAATADGREVMGLYEGIDLDELNDGSGVATHRVLADIEFRLRDGTSGSLDLSPIIAGGSDVAEEKTLGDVLKLIRDAAPGKLKVEIAPDGDRLLVTDLTQGDGTFQLTAINDSAALEGLGLDGAATDGVLVGRRLLAGTGTVLLSSLGGGNGLGKLGSLQLTDRSGATATVALSAAETLQDVIDAISGAGVGITARVNRARNGIELVDTTGASTGHLIVRDVVALVAGDADRDFDVDATDIQAILRAGRFNTGQPADWSQGDFNADGLVSPQDIQMVLQAGQFNKGAYAQSSTAAALGIAVDAAVTAVNSGDLHLQVVAPNSRLNGFNGGAGVARGTLEIIDSAGQRATLNLRNQNIQTIGDVIQEINRLSVEVQAEINATGDGIVLRDLARGAGSLQVVEGSSTTAADLHLLGPAAEIDFQGQPSQVIDGATTYTLTLDDKTSLSDLRQKINDLHAGVTAAMFVDGSNAPYRLALMSDRAGKAGELLLDSSAVGFTFDETVAAQDALLAFGQGSGAAPGILIASSSNTFRDVLAGVSLEIKRALATPVPVTVSMTDTDLVASARTMVDNYNAFRKRLAELTKYNTETQERSLLTGDATALRLDTDLSYLLSGRFVGAGSIHGLPDLGIRLDEKGLLSLDESKLKAAYAADPAGVEQFLSDKETGAAVKFDKLFEQLGGERISLLARRTESLDDKISHNRERVDFMNKRLDVQRERLLLQFYRMEVAIGKMQNTLSALNSIQALPSLVSASKR